MKIIALDIGDKWTGVAISDPLGIIARPHQTVATKELVDFLRQTIATERVTTVVVGLPVTLRSTESEQTKKTKTVTEQLKQLFDTVDWIYWDERLTSKQAARLKPAKIKKDKLQIHAIAAALILSSYLEHLQLQKEAS